MITGVSQCCSTERGKKNKKNTLRILHSLQDTSLTEIQATQNEFTESK